MVTNHCYPLHSLTTTELFVGTPVVLADDRTVGTLHRQQDGIVRGGVENEEKLKQRNTDKLITHYLPAFISVPYCSKFFWFLYYSIIFSYLKVGKC